MHSIRQKLESVFSDIAQTRMHDMPVCNPALKVKAFGFDAWSDYYLGVLLTPWFMNLVLLPRDSSVTDGLQPGEKQKHTFQSGYYEFVVGEEPRLGKFLVCSLFSPVFEFADQEIADETACAILDEIMQVRNYEGLDGIDKQNSDSSQTATQGKSRSSANDKLSRRDFLRGKITANRV